MFTEHVQSRVERRVATRGKVLDAAERLFREHGFGSTTVRQIAAEAGVSTGTVMAVGDKATLLVAIFDGWIGAVHRDRSGRAAQSSQPALTRKQAVDEIVGLLEPFLEYFTLDLTLAREYASILVRGDHESVVFTDLARALTDELNSALARTGLTPAAAERGARTVYFLYLGVLMAAAGGAIDEAAVEEQFRAAVRFTLVAEGDHR